jgi:hypothetical protein
MHKIDGPGATAENQFTGGDVQEGIPATTVTPEIMNALQDEVSNVIEGRGITLDKNDNTQLAQAIGVAAQGFKNMLVNGEFIYHQRNDIGSSSSTQFTLGDQPVYTCDRWLAWGDDPGGIGAGQFRPDTLTGGHSIIAVGTEQAGDRQYTRQVVTIVGGAAGVSTIDGPGFEQRVEGLEFLGGKDVTFSVYLGADIQVTGRLELEQSFGTGSGASASELIVTDNIQIQAGAGLRRFELSALMPNIESKTINGTAYLTVRFAADSGQVGSNDQINIALAQCELGTSATFFERRPDSVELGLCQRYYETSYDTEGGPTSGSSPGPTEGHSTSYSPAGTTCVGLGQRFMVEKRAAPTMVWINPDDDAKGEIDWGGSKTVIGTTDSAGRTHTGEPITSPAGPLGIARGHWTADSEI